MNQAGNLQRVSPLRSPRLDDRELNTLSRIIRDCCGLNMTANKRMLLQNRLGRRLRALGFDGFGAYCKYLETPAGARKERGHLWSAVTTNQTHFFREMHHFHTLTTHLLPELAKRRSITKTVRLWSAGCSTGQEPYTLAMVLTDWCSRHSGWSFRVLATDIDQQALAVAQRGLYPLALRKEIDAQRYLRYCTAEDSSFRVNKSLQGRLTFRHQNLADTQPVRPKADIIFCRNVTMYLHGDIRVRLANMFHESLADHGVVILGSSENFRRNQHPFELERHGKTTMYRKRDLGRHRHEHV